MSTANQYRVRFKLVTGFPTSAEARGRGRKGWKKQVLLFDEPSTERNNSALIRLRPGHDNEAQPSSEDDSETTRRVAIHRQRAVSAIHPMTILQKGNSDPFNTSVIPIEAETNETLLFYQSNVLPVLVACMEAGGVSSSVGTAAWISTLPSLLNEGTAYGFLARSAAAMSCSAGAEPLSRLAVNALTYKNKMSRMLRAYLAGGEQHLFKPRVYNIVVSMLITAIFENGLEEAAVHARMLEYIMYKLNSRTSKEVDLGILYKVMWHDFHRASKTLARMTFNGDWVANLFRPGWQQALKDLPDLSGQAEIGLDKSIKEDSDRRLRALFINLRELIEILTLLMLIASPRASTQISVTQWFMFCLGQLIDGYVDSIEALGEGTESTSQYITSMHDWDCYTKAYTCLAALWWSRCLLKMENAPTGPASAIFNASEKIIPALKNALIQSSLHSDGLDDLTNGRARLWALYVGAVAEQHIGIGRVSRTGRPCLGMEESWFVGELQAQAKKMHLLTWSDLRRVLQGFLYSDGIQPHGSTWFTGA
jgi:hypothetical protein